MQRTILAVFAHPDDETSAGGLLAKYSREGHIVHLVSLTSGELGAARGVVPPGEKLGRIREDELRCAAKQLGIREPLFLRLPDQGLFAPDHADTAIAHLRKIIEEVRPDILITWGPDGLTGHPDHKAASNIVSEVFQEQSVLSHKPKKLYFVVYPESCPLPSLKGRTLRPVSDEFVTAEIDCTEYMGAVSAAIRCHRSQWDEERMEWIHQVHAEALAGRVFLRLVLSSMPASGRETCILRGLS